MFSTITVGTRLGIMPRTESGKGADLQDHRDVSILLLFPSAFFFSNRIVPRSKQAGLQLEET